MRIIRLYPIEIYLVVLHSVRVVADVCMMPYEKTNESVLCRDALRRAQCAVRRPRRGRVRAPLKFVLRRRCFVGFGAGVFSIDGTKPGGQNLRIEGDTGPGYGGPCSADFSYMIRPLPWTLNICQEKSMFNCLNGELTTTLRNHK